MTTVQLAPIRLTVRPLGTVQVNASPTVRRITASPVVRDLVVQVLTRSITVSPVGVQGRPGAPGAGGGTQEVFVQATQPTETGQPYLWIETDVDGNPTGNEYVWIP